MRARLEAFVIQNKLNLEPAERREGTAKRSLLHPSRSLRICYPLHHPFGVGSGWHSTPSATITQWSILRSCVLTLKLKAKKFAPKLHLHSVNYTAKLIHTRRIPLPLSTLQDKLSGAGSTSSLRPA